MSAGQDFRAYDAALWDRHSAALDFSGKSIFITGATGFIGSVLLALLAHLWRAGKGAQVLALSRNPDAFLAVHPEFRGLQWLQWLKGDLLDGELPQQSFDYLIHCAHIVAVPAGGSPLAIYDSTIAASRRILDMAALKGGRVLLVSTGGVAVRNGASSATSAELDGECDWFGTISAYCEGKRASEVLASLYHACRNVDVVTVRPYSIVGPGLLLDGHYALGNFIRDALWGDEISIHSDGSSVRSYIYVADLAIWFLRILSSGHAGQVYNVGSDKGVNLCELARLVARALGVDKTIRVHDGVSSGDVSPQARSYYVPDITRPVQELGLAAWTDLVTAIRLTAEAANKQGKGV